MLYDFSGIGTDATHAEHIETIKSRMYVGVRNDGRFVPGELGMGLVEGESLKYLIHWCSHCAPKYHWHSKDKFFDILVNFCCIFLFLFFYQNILI